MVHLAICPNLQLYLIPLRLYMSRATQWLGLIIRCHGYFPVLCIIPVAFWHKNILQNDLFCFDFLHKGQNLEASVSEQIPYKGRCIGLHLSIHSGKGY